VPGPFTSKDTASGRRWLCSHLVELQFDGERFPARTALLEEIDAQGAAVAVESPYPTGTRLKIKAGVFEIPAEIVFRLPRETDFLLWARFAAGCRWDPAVWQPDHLYLPPRRQKKLRRAAGQGG
jgi:hypothetical protein